MAWGSSDFVGADNFVSLVYLVLCPPMFVAMFGTAVQTFFAARDGDRERVVRVFRRWVAWCMGGWTLALLLALVFSGN